MIINNYFFYFMIQSREDTRRSVESVRCDPQFLDQAGIERLTREIDQVI